MKLSDYKGEQAIDVLVELMEPATAIMADKEVARLAQSKVPVIKIAKAALKNHKKEVIEILAVLDGEDPKEYAEKITVFTLPAKLLEVLNDPMMQSLFSLQGQTKEASSTSALENTEANEQ